LIIEIGVPIEIFLQIWDKKKLKNKNKNFQ
jgi:hypothetical protein